MDFYYMKIHIIPGQPVSGRFYVNPDITVSIRVYCLECLCPTLSAEGCKVNRRTSRSAYFCSFPLIC